MVVQIGFWQEEFDDDLISHWSLHPLSELVKITHLEHSCERFVRIASVTCLTSPPLMLSPPMSDSFSFQEARDCIQPSTLRMCQREALEALEAYYAGGGDSAACVMSVGAGKTVLGVAACLKFCNKRALIVTPGKVIRGTFAKALDAGNSKSALYHLPRGPLLVGCQPPKTITLTSDSGPIKSVDVEALKSADIVITNYHSLGDGSEPGHLLAKLEPDDFDLIVVDEAHIAAADSYQRCFEYFSNAKKLLMSACFERHDGKPIDADVVYQYRLIESVIDGHAKPVEVCRFDPSEQETIYEIVWPDGSREEIHGRDQILERLNSEKKLANISAKSIEPIRRVMELVVEKLREQEAVLAPVRPRVLFSALGLAHAKQISKIANEAGINCDYLHHSMTAAQIKSVRRRFEEESGDLQAVVQLKMLGQGYDLPAITIVVPMRPYGSFGEFYQFIGRGVRAIHHPSLVGRVTAKDQKLSIVFHGDLGLDAHINTICEDNFGLIDQEAVKLALVASQEDGEEKKERSPSDDGPEVFVLVSPGSIDESKMYTVDRLEQKQEERFIEAMAQLYSQYVATVEKPVPFDQFVAIQKSAGEV